eukprot:TRINITY_DN1771_c0_g1_i1.p1 TRINITY_DN1771_c0_g1~~TRINITY_DN1771_c0_g1_i1.p1  ORF type:complete len:345 (-),score=65.82 TRINITY_DN1771_c0_g1_i1:11-1045(-)
MGDKAEDLGDGMQCSEHPYRNNPGGICAFCLQEKLGKLVSSSKSNNPFCPIPQSSTSSSSPSFRSESSAPPHNPHLGAGSGRNTRVPFSNKKKVMASEPSNAMLKRSKSVAPQRHHHHHKQELFDDTDSPRKRGFWSFLHPSTRKTIPQTQTQTQTQKEQKVAGSSGDQNESPNTWSSSAIGRKVARSRSVGCGSRSFSGDFLERISTGLGDCTLRRVESQREAKPKIVMHRVATADERMKERVKCGGIFGGFGLVSSSYWISEDLNGGGRFAGPPAHGRNKSWGWAAAFASPMRGFRPSSKTPSYIADKEGKGESGRGGATDSKANTSNNDMPTIPSYLAVKG